MNRLHRLIITALAGGPSDTTAPTVVITSSESSPTTVIPIPITITFSESVTGFAIGDLTVGNGSASNFAGSGAVYTCDIIPAPNAAVTVDISAGVCVDGAGNSNTAATQFAITSSAFTLADEFTDTVAAGSVNGTTATPSGQTRTVTDTNSKISVGSGVLNVATGGANNNGPWYPTMTRVAGKTLFSSLTVASGGIAVVGYDTAQSGGIAGNIHINLSSLTLNIGASVTTLVGASAAATQYYLALVARGTGFHGFIKGGTWTNWTLLYSENTGTGALFPATQLISSAVYTVDFMRVPATLLTVTPLASDAFTRADGALGNTGGGGSDESGGTGLAWTDQVGTWGVATNKAACSALSGGVGIATVPCGTQNIMAEVVATRSAGTSGLCLRYTDSSNYIKCVHNGTNLQVVEVVAGTPNTLINAAATYGAAFRMVVSLNGTKVRAYYNNSIVGAEATTAVTTGNNHGIFTDDTGATFDNFVVWSKGVGGEYDTQFNKYINP